MKKILVPFDFSDCSKEALKFAHDLSIRQQGEMHVLHVVDLPVLYETTFGVQPNLIDVDLLKSIADDARSRYTEFAEANGYRNITRFEILNGPVAPMIREYVNDSDIDLVIMGTKGASGLKEFFIGSNTEKVVRLSPVPVIAIRKAPIFTAVKNILLPNTLELNQTDFMNEVKELQNLFGARLHVLLLNTPMNFRRDADNKALLEEFASFYKLRNYQLHIYNESFEADGIIHVARDISADMIAMATHSRRGINHFMMGSIAEDVVNHLENIPIWTYSLKYSRSWKTSDVYQERKMSDA